MAFSYELRKIISQIPIEMEEYMSSPDYIPAEIFRHELELSPAMFVGYLRKHRSELPIFGELRDYIQGYRDGESAFIDDRSWFYNCNRENTTALLPEIFIHRMDLSNHKKKHFPVTDENEDVTITKLKTQLAQKDARIAELEAQLNTSSGPTTTVNAAKWGNSVNAAFSVWVAIITGDKTDWKEDEFRAALAERCGDYHTEVHAIAWSLLPRTFKHGSGRPKKTLHKSQQSDKS